jgi:hypothetical protein
MGTRLFRRLNPELDAIEYMDQYDCFNTITLVILMIELKYKLVISIKDCPISSPDFHSLGLEKEIGH